MSNRRNNNRNRNRNRSRGTTTVALPVRAQQGNRPKNASASRNGQRQKKTPKGLTTVPVDPDVKKWSDLMADPFSAPFSGVYMPLAENGFPCPSKSYSNYAEIHLGATALPTDTYHIWCFPDPYMRGAVEETYEYTKATWLGTAQEGVPGVGLDANGDAGVAFGYIVSAGADPVTQPATNLTIPVFFEPLTVPMALTYTPAANAQTGYEFRTFAAGIEIEYAGKLLDTEGYVEFASPFESGEGATGSVATWATLKRDPSYRRHYFAAGRVARFTWLPNCEGVKFTPLDADTAGARATQPRMIMNVVGIGTTGSLNIRYIQYQEVTTRRIGGLDVNRYVSPDASHVKNALMSHRGASNPVQGLSRRKPLHLEVAAHKLRAHPHLRTLANVAEGGAASAGLMSGARQLVKYIASEGAESLGALAEYAIPLL